MATIIEYKKKLIDLFDNYTGSIVLDYGCGKGDFIEIILNKDKARQIWAVDTSEEMLEKVKERFAKEIANKVIIKKASSPNELQGNNFDKIICHNVLECVDDKLSFINSFTKILKPDGILILSHHDFDSAIFNSAFKPLTRDLIHHFSDTQQAWQTFSDGQMGRKIPGLLSRSEFINHFECVTWRLVEREFKEGNYGFLMASMVMEVGKPIFDPSELQAWFNDLKEKNAKGDFYFAIDLVVAKISL